MSGRRQRLIQRRKTLGFSQEELAHALGVERSTVVRWESGEREPRPWHRPKLAAVLRVSLEDVDAYLACQADERPEAERLARALAEPAAVDLVTAAHRAERVQHLTAEYDSSPSTSLIADAGRCHSQVALLRASAPNRRIRRELCTSAAESATLMGRLVWDASQRRDHAVPVRYFDQAIDAAREAGDPMLEAHAQLRKGFVALYGTKNVREGLRLCEETVTAGRSPGNVLTGLGLLHVGEAYAMLGERRDCEKALGAAEDTLARLGRDDEARHLFSPSQFGRLAGSCYLFLGLNDKAERILAASARQPVRGKKSQAIVLGNLALARLRQGRAEEACGPLHEAIDLIEATRGGGGFNIAFTAGRELSPWRHERWAQEVGDRLFCLMAA
ncbi:transcriptional regulator [Spongiactinospora gelatinilytica]|uniref:Transcriptional regulator n=1 Tax=Spongiactinospora gelatinilytica TaxID=2666298 RepID=A0A2W2F2E9_9ACTN|nr:helix-turn-helix transcriptional regulator [Spongiactinospora gelatinilytica]PZG31086.1 transcriptional regulator [Spongiactinospora gelatinilytica]